MNSKKSFSGGKISNHLESSTHSLFDNSQWLKTEEAAAYLSTTPAQIRNWVYQGKIKSYKLLGNRLRFKLSDLDLLMEGGQYGD